ncbi:MAG: bifunctional folylpolyglutamate synthase/dihydrofolate synthase [Gammaproteobacteria bacterium]|nr:bifunctional folylpolyglutamate synthase/dihydrofolate synthase [Gammaproteobacteria bacterium]
MNSSIPESSSPGGTPATLGEWLSLLEYRHHTAIDLGLDRCRAVWRRMASPCPAERIFVVAGTNGKGSTVATICGLLKGLGYRFGSYTTPHIHDYNERVQVMGCNARDEALIESFHRVEAALGDVSLSYFEFGTLAAFDLLSRQSLEFAVMEVGLGGRLDAVNLLDADCTVITPIGLDHQEYLGSDREQIGREKAGIIRRQVPLVLGDRDPPRSVLETAELNEAPVSLIGRDFEAGPCNGHARYRVGDTQLELPLPTLRGAHQFDNAATGLAAVLALLPEAMGRQADLAAGIESVDLHGRFERVRQDPEVWIDVGHNPLGARVIANALENGGGGRGGGIRCVLAMLAVKVAEWVVAELDHVVSEWYCAGLEGDRGQTGERLALRVGSVVQPGSVQQFVRVQEALHQALADSDPADGVLVFGSFHTADEADHEMINSAGGNGAGD